MDEKVIDKRKTFTRFTPYNKQEVQSAYEKALISCNKKIVVLDDDPTGVQTVHDVFVYTDWSRESILKGFEDKNPIFFVLTNSRGFTEEQTTKVHREIAENVVAISRQTGKDFIIISRGDSTLRGHYPLETDVLRETLEKEMNIKVDGEVIIPFFTEGGRYTIDNIHYVAEGDILNPAGNTEFAKDKTFGYKSSDLTGWVEEKTKGLYKKEDVLSITLEELRSCSYDRITEKLNSVSRFNKIIVNAMEYEDVKVFVTALIKSMNAGKHFMFRSAAALTKVIGGISDQELLCREQLVNTANKNGGVIIVGSHVNKTTRQLNELMKLKDIAFIEFNQHLVLDDAAFQAELDRVIEDADKNIENGRTVAIYTRRERFDLNNGNSEDELRVAVKISDAVTRIVGRLKVRPNFIIAKGGITSSDVGTKGLGVKKALVMGQILKGIPVWLTGPESKFPNMPYVIFPGNVGTDDSLREAVSIMQPNL
jgi:Uncharacterized protein conserved in bacteria